MSAVVERGLCHSRAGTWLLLFLMVVIASPFFSSSPGGIR